MQAKDILPETINKAHWAMLEVHKCPFTYHVDNHSGHGCAGDPPGFPTYFTKSVWTQHGNHPARGASILLFGRIVQTNIMTYDLRKLWKPLPLDHPRTRAWINDRYRHLHKCYCHPTEQEYGRRKIVIYPVPYYEFRNFEDDLRFSEAWREKEKAAIEQQNAEIISERKAIATPENHSAVHSIREFYPEYQPEIDLIDSPLKLIANWWERLDECPKPEDCPGDSVGKHPVNGTWCQCCGWKEGE